MWDNDDLGRELKADQDADRVLKALLIAAVVVIGITLLAGWMVYESAVMCPR